MAQEEKAKVYDEALEKARKRVATGPQDHTGAILKDIFPDFREDEDERIRKEIVTFLKEGTPYHCPNSIIRQKWATWLERQKEQKSLRPYWKPSAEQMKHLERCFSHGHTVQLPNQWVLKSLYDDLKKL